MREKTQLKVDLDPELHTKLKHRSVDERRTMAEIVRRAVKVYLASTETLEEAAE